MTTLTNPYQVINDNLGIPQFVVVPYDDFKKLTKDESAINIKNAISSEVVGLIFDKNLTAAQAWREYFGITQTEAATKLGINQPAYSQLEATEHPNKKKRSKLRMALGVTVEQLGC